MKFYKVIKRESKTGINFRIKPEGTPHFGWKELDGAIQARNIEQAAKAFKQIINGSLAQRGFLPD
ncbi:MAG TPA: hypothetical protein VMW64_07495 [Dehalococcoidia bacterium]|nr:hypothetical protein [Dehalococcoidia bacterium]